MAVARDLTRFLVLATMVSVQESAYDAGFTGSSPWSGASPRFGAAAVLSHAKLGQGVGRVFCVLRLGAARLRALPMLLRVGMCI